MPDRVLIWKKWVSPFSTDNSDLEYVPEEEVAKINNFDHYDEDFSDHNHDYNFQEMEERSDKSQIVVVTPLGVLPIKSSNDVTKVCNFWMGEVNFNLSEQIALTLNSIEGVEFLDIFSRYKFRISIGNCFAFQDVSQRIKEALGVTISQETKDRYETKIKE